jgi:hypothetical protein
MAPHAAFEVLLATKGVMRSRVHVLSAFTAALLFCNPSSGAAQAQKRTISPRRLKEIEEASYFYARGPVGPSLLKALKKQVGKIDPCLNPGTRNLPQFHAESVSLGKAGSERLVVAQGPLCYCSATGNCPLFVFRKTVRGYEAVGSAEAAQTFAITGDKTKGLPDIVLSRTESYDWSRLFLAQFDGKLYRAVGCYDSRYSYKDTKDGPFREHKKPKVTLCGE